MMSSVFSWLFFAYLVSLDDEKPIFSMSSQVTIHPHFDFFCVKCVRFGGARACVNLYDIGDSDGVQTLELPMKSDELCCCIIS